MNQTGKAKIWALYKEGSYLGDGTLRELSEKHNIKLSTLRWYTSKTYNERLKERKRKGAYYLIDLEKEVKPKRKAYKSLYETYKKLYEQSKISVLKEKKGVPTKIKVGNHTYILLHPDQYKGVMESRNQIRSKMEEMK